MGSGIVVFGMAVLPKKLDYAFLVRQMLVSLHFVVKQCFVAGVKRLQCELIALQAVSRRNSSFELK